MLSLLQAISQKALLLNDADFDYTDEQKRSGWIGEPPATETAILQAEKNLQLTLPEDYKQFLRITDGFPAYETTGVTFSRVKEIDYLINVDPDLIEIWSEDDALHEVAVGLQSSLLVGGLGEEQYFLLLPPSASNDTWRYWKFASWMAGEHAFDNLTAYFDYELASLTEQTDGLTAPPPKRITDLSLIDAVYTGNWQKVFETSLRFLQEDIVYYYFERPFDLLNLLVLSAHQTNQYDQLPGIFEDLKKGILSDITDPLQAYEAAIHASLVFVPSYQTYAYTPRPDSPLSLKDLQLQIAKNVPRLLRPTNVVERIHYELFSFFHEGSPQAYVQHYEQQLPLLMDSGEDHIQAAVVFATMGELSKAKAAIRRYLSGPYNYRVLAPFLHATLFPLMDAGFSQEMLILLQSRKFPE